MSNPKYHIASSAGGSDGDTDRLGRACLVNTVWVCLIWHDTTGLVHSTWGHANWLDTGTTYRYVLYIFVSKLGLVHAIWAIWAHVI